MDVKTAIQTRRAVKYYDPDHEMGDGEISELMSLATESPTAFNLQNWRFVLVKDQALREQIREAAWGQAQVTDSSLLIVLCADLKAWEKQPERTWVNASRDVQDFVLPAIQQYYEGRDQVQRDEAMRSCGIAAQTLMLAAKDMGYDSCPMDGFDFDKVGTLINLPDDHVIAMFVVVGKKVKDAHPRAGALPMDELIVTDRF